MKTLFGKPGNEKSIYFFFIVLFLYGLTSCSKEKPTVTTEPVTEILSYSAVSGGKVLDDGNADITSRGVCWNTSPSPTIENCINFTEDGAGMGIFTSNMTGLSQGENYHVRAYAANSEGTAYGENITFETKQLPNVTTLAPLEVSKSSATFRGTVNVHGVSSEVTFDYGKTKSYGNSITAIQSPVAGNSAVDVSANVSGLAENSIYHYRVKIVSPLGETLGNDVEFKTSQTPTAITNSLTDSDIQVNSATLRGMVNANGYSTTVIFEYGTSISYGNTVSANLSPVSGTTDTYVSASITELSPNTTYNFRIKAESTVGPSFGENKLFKTKQCPIAATGLASNISFFSATLNATINTFGVPSVVIFEYGTTTSFGSSVTAIQSPVSNPDETVVSANIEELQANRKYYYRVRVENPLCTEPAIGEPVDFTTIPKTVYDADNNKYNIIQIGEQFWFEENLKTTKFHDTNKTPIENYTGSWTRLLSPAYCWYLNDIGYKEPYGALYNWYAVDAGNLCPKGWHVPTNKEWVILEEYIFEESRGDSAGGLLKEAGILYWDKPNKGATNKYGFSALPGGIKNSGASLPDFDLIRKNGYYWTSTLGGFQILLNPYYRKMTYDASTLFQNTMHRGNGISVRCIRD